MSKFKILFALSAASLLLVTSLYILSDDPNRKSTGFLRSLHTAALLSTLRNNEGHVFRIGTIGGVRLILVDVIDGEVYQTSPMLDSVNQMGIQLNTSIGLSDRIYGSDNNVGVVDFDTQSFLSVNLLSGITSSSDLPRSFIEAVPFSANQVATRVVDSEGNIVIARYDVFHGFHPVVHRISNRRKDLIELDGQIIVDARRNRIAYMYYYIGRIEMMDTTLTDVRRFETIDTTSTPRIHVFESDRTGDVVLSSPPVIVNDAGFLDGQYIYVCSRLKADNQSREQFIEYSVVDRYSLTGAYYGSIAIKNIWGEPLKRFMVCDSLMYAEYKQGLAVFNIDRPWGAPLL